MTLKQVPALSGIPFPQTGGMRLRVQALIATLAISALAGCGGGGSSDGSVNNPDPNPAPATVSISGALHGNAGSVTLSLNGQEQVFSGSNFTFTQKVTQGQSYAVAFVSESTGLVCAVAGGNGTTQSDVTTIMVNCNSGNEVTGNRRILRLNYDLDNNGIIDSVRSFNYDSDGRIVAEDYVYSGDGTPDTNFGSFSIDGPAYNQSVTYSYNSAGLLNVWSTTQQGSRTDMVYDYGADALTDQLALDTYNSSGALIDHSVFNLSYTAGSLTGWEFRLGDNTLIQSNALTYSISTQVQSDLLTQTLGGAQSLFEYTTSATGKIDLIHTSNPESGSTFFNDVDFVYDTADRLVSRVTTSSKTADNYRWNYAYDSNDELTTKQIDLASNGTIEATITAEWEDGACRTVFSWAPRAEANFVASATIPYAPSSGYVVIPVCSSQRAE